MPFNNTPEVDPTPARPRVKTGARGADIAPEGVSPAGPTSGARGKYPKSNGGPPESHPEWMSSRSTGDHKTPDVPANGQVPPVATRKTPRVAESSKNPVK